MRLPGRVAVTGATGFLGSHLSRELACQGSRVWALGRDLSRGSLLADEGIEFRPVHLDDLAGLTSVFSRVDAVVHSAALSAAWGSKRAFAKANIEGTANVLQAAMQAGVGRLVYVSSPSVSSRRMDQRSLVETDLADSPDSDYTRSKLAAEVLVRQSSLNSVIVRPKAIYGPGDTALLPRIIKALRSGHLKRIGDGHTTINLTHVSDAVAGILSALTRDAAVGRTYVLTGAEDINLWDLIDELAQGLGLPEPAGRISISRAYQIAYLLELAWRWLRLSGEPPLTRYTVGILGYDNTYDISAAMRDLNYAPVVKVRQGLQEVLNHERRAQKSEKLVRVTRPVQRQMEVDFSLLNGGTVATRQKYFDVQGDMRRITVPNLFAAIDHPQQGVVLFDTGYTERFHEATQKLPHCLYALATPVTITPEQTAVSQLAARGVSAESVRWIVLSHFHPDHYGGLKDFPNATIVCRASAWASVRGKRGVSALRAYLLPGHLPEDISARLQILPRELPGPAYGSFGPTFDLFNDGSVRLVDLPGHAPGHIGALVQGVDNRSHLLVADAVWTMSSFAYPGKGLHRLLAEDTGTRDATVRLLRDFQLRHPQVSIIPAHCPVTAEKFGFVINRGGQTSE